MARPQVIVLTNCTGRKRQPARAALRARSLHGGDLLRTSREWVSRLEDAQYQFVADQLYCGRAIRETLEACEALGGAETVFVSAGLSIVPQHQRIPSYSLTASPGHPDSISDRIKGSCDPASWWQALAKAKGSNRPLAEFIESRSAALVLVAMPATYLAMVAPEFADLSIKVLKTVRVMGPRRREEVHASLRACWLPYDARLDSPRTGVNGTASDFPHRALRHFAVRVLPNSWRGTRQSHADDVEKSLSRFKAYVRRRGQSASDEEIISEILALWTKHRGRRAGILRELRSKRNIACEQSRFRSLANRVAARFNAGS
jgi:hypothetical protein